MRKIPLAFDRAGRRLLQVFLSASIVAGAALDAEARIEPQLPPFAPRQVVFHPSEPSRLLVLEGNGIVGLWDLRDPEEPVRLLSLHGSAAAAGFTPDGEQILTAQWDGRLRFWDLNGTLENEVVVGPFALTAMSAAAELVATESADGQVHIWNLEGQLLTRLQPEDDKLLGTLELSSTGERLATGHVDGTIRLWNLEGKLEETFETSQGPISALAFGPRDQWLASADEGGSSVRLWGLSDPYRGLPALEHEDSVLDIAVARQGGLLASAGLDKTVRLWNLDGSPRGEPLWGHSEAIGSIALSADGKRLASIDGDGELRFWEIGWSRQGDPFGGHGAGVRSVRFLPGRNLAAVGNGDGSVQLWQIDEEEPNQWKELWTATVAHPIGPVAFSPDGDLLIFGDSRGQVHFRDLAGGEPRMPVEAHPKVQVHSLEFLPDGTGFASSADDESIRIWNRDGSPRTPPIRAHRGWTGQLAISPRGDLLATGGGDGLVRLWTPDGVPRGEPLRHEEPVWPIAFSSDGELIAAGGDRDGAILLWTTDGAPLGQTLRGHEGPVCCLSFQGGQLASGGRDGTVRLWSLDGDGRSSVLTQHPEIIGSTSSLAQLSFATELGGGPISALAWMPESRYLVSSARDGRLWLRAPDGRFAWSLNTRGNRVTALALAPDDKLFATSGSDSQIAFWRRGEDGAFAAASDPLGLVRSLAFSPDGKFLASGGNDRTVRLWSAQGWPLGEPFRGHESEVLQVAFSPDGTLIASGDATGSIRFWMLDGRPWGRGLQEHAGAITALAFSPDGKRLAAAAGEAGTVWLWDVMGLTRQRTLEAPLSSISSLAFRSDGRSLVAAGGDRGEAYAWSLDLASSDPEPERVIEGHPAFRPQETPTRILHSVHSALSPTTDSVMSAGREGLGFRDSSGHHETLTSEPTDLSAFSPSGRYLLSGHGGRMQLWSHDGKPRGRGLRSPERVIERLLFFPDQKQFLTLDGLGEVRHWTLDGTVSGRRLETEPIRSFALSPNGGRVALGSRSGDIHLFDSELEPVAPPFLAHRNGVFALDFSSDGHQLVSSGYHEAIVWDVRHPSAREVARAEVGTGSVHFLPGLPRVSFMADRALHFWDFPSEPKRVEMGVSVAAVSPARSRDLAALGDDDGFVVLAEMEDESARILGQHPARIESLVFAPDEGRLASLDELGTVRLWNTVTPEPTGPSPMASAASQVGFLSDTLWILSPPGIVSFFDPSLELLGRAYLTPEGILLAAENGFYSGKGEIVRNFTMYSDSGRRLSESDIAERFDSLRATASTTGRLSSWQEIRAILHDTIELLTSTYRQLPPWAQIFLVTGTAYGSIFLVIAALWWSKPARLAAWAMPEGTHQELEGWKHLAQALALIRRFGTSRRALDAWMRAHDQELFESAFASRPTVQNLSAFADLGQSHEIAQWLDAGAQGRHAAAWIRGPGGCGKTTLACHMARRRREDESSHPVLPIFVDSWIKGTLFEQVRPLLKAGGSCPTAETVEKLANAGRLLFVVDGLSEMGRPAEEPVRLASRFRESNFPLIVTTRASTYPRDTFQVIDLAPIPDHRLPDLAAAYVAEDEVAEAVAALRQLTRQQAIKPLFARLALELFQENGDVPATYPDLVWKYTREASKGKLSENELYRAASIAAKVCCEKALAPRAETCERILAFLQAELERFGIEQELPPARVLEELVSCGLLEYISEDLIYLRFANDVIAEYFMARYIEEHGNSAVAMKLRRSLQQSGESAQGLRDALEQMDRALQEHLESEP